MNIRGIMTREVIIVAIVVIILGFLLHFLYGWLNKNRLVAPYSSVNESVWEHLKLIAVPILLTGVISGMALKKNNIAAGILLGALAGMAIIITMFYSYVGALTHPKTSLPIDIGIYIAGAIVSTIVMFQLFNRRHYKNLDLVSAGGLIVLMIAVFSFSIKSPNLPIFYDFSNHE